MPRVRIVHWKEEESAPLITACRAAGVDVTYDALDFPGLVRLLRADPPDALVIDLTRMPSHGRDAAMWLRRSKQTRNVRLIFVDGEPDKVDAIRKLLPDATYLSRKQIRVKLAAACRKTVVEPVVPPPPMQQYSSRTVAQKLGIKPGVAVALMDAPRNYSTVIGELPGDVELLEDSAAVQEITLWFVTEPEVYRSAVRRMRSIAARTKLWVIWKKGSTKGLTQYIVRSVANEAGLVDYKICALHEQWSGMAFAPRKS